ncbi:MAG: LuxR C-terminal-related transcriptional regulator [Crocinitomicaceae bacterium]|nr:LuxR C-terminal-related transcriptional regulator [Crocinitomicaceae bacterium]
MDYLRKKHVCTLLILLGIICSSPMNGLSQDNSIDQIIQSNQGSERIESLYEYGISLKHRDTSEIFKVAQSIQLYAEKSKNKVGIAYAHALFVQFYNARGDYGNVLNHSMEAINQQCPDTLEACMKIRKSISRILSEIGQNRSALEQEIYILDYYKSRLDYGQSSKTCARIGKLYFNLSQVDSGLVYYRLAIIEMEKSDNKKSIRNSYNNIGLAFQELGILDSAQFYFEKGLVTFELYPANSRNDSLMYGLLSGNIGNIYYLRGDYDRALELLNIDKRYNSKNGGNSSSFNATVLIAKIHLIKNNASEALANLLEAEKIINSGKVRRQHALSLYKCFVDVYHALHDYSKADYYFDQYSALNDSLQVASTSSQNEMQQAFIDEIINRELEMQRIANEKKEQEIIYLQQQEDLSQYKIIVLIGLVIMVIIISGFYIIRYRSNVKKRQEINRIKGQLIKTELDKKELEQGILREELGVKNNQLTNFALDISRKHDFTDALMQRLKTLRKKSSPEMLPEVNDLMIFARNELNIDKSLHELQENIAKIHFSFFENLEKTHPDLTKTEKYMCGLLRIELSNNEIAILREVSVDSVKVSKNRLRRKMKLEQRTDLTKYLRSL